MNHRAIALFCIILLLMVGVVSANTTIFTVAADGSQDGFLYSTMGAGTTWQQMRDYTSGTDTTGAVTYAVSYSRTTVSPPDWYRLGRPWFEIDTSSIPDDATIDYVNLSVYVVAASNALGAGTYSVTGFSPATQGAIASGDFDSFGNVVFSDNRTYAEWTPDGAIKNFTFTTAGKNAINKTGYTNLMIRDTYDIDNSYGWTWANYVRSFIEWYSGETAGSRPFLTVGWTAGAPDTTPPASITNLANITTCQNITFQWTNPTDADFGGIHNWLNDVAQDDIDNTTTSILFEDLEENTAYTFSTKTFDILGNTNTTWVNLTSTTDTCPIPTTSPTTTATTASPTPTPTPLAGCTYFNLTGVTFGINSTDWNAMEGLNTWGVSTFNATQGNVSWWICRATPTITTPVPWQPLINPSTDIKTDWFKLLWEWLWLPVLILAMILLFGRK